ncbi:MAG: hypothetical protein GY824_04555 [Delftia sp.]|nr:hypothetical protein [Delftia sp.]
MSCNKCAKQAEAALRAAGVPARQTQAGWASDEQHPQCPACGAFTTRRGECVSPRCALQRLLDDCPALNQDDLAPDDAQAVEGARATLARVEAQAAQALRLLLDCPALNTDGLGQDEAALVEAARGAAGLSELPDAGGSWQSRVPQDKWWKGEEWKGLRGQILAFARSRSVADGDRVSLAGFPQRRALPRGCWLDSKEIRGNGPYLYLRWRAGPRQRSKYLGKGSASPSPSAGATEAG